MKCEKCGAEHDGKIGSGRFCSLKCVRGFSTFSKRNAINKQVSFTLKNKLKFCIRCGKKIQGSNLCKDCKIKDKTHVCELCGDSFVEYLRFGRKIQCKKCRKKFKRGKRNVASILQLSKKTTALILRRARFACVLCGWNKSSCDIHHIVHKKLGGTDSHENLIVVCPNCHREIHREKKINADFLRTKTIDKTFTNWRDFYYY
jgi:hypothetical protein